MNEEGAVAAFAALAQESRLRILRYLVEQGPQGASAGDISAAIGVSASGASFHLSTLADAGLVTATRVSRSIIYQIDFNLMGQLAAYLINDCCGNHKAVTACC